METEAQIIEREIGTNGATYESAVIRRLLDEEAGLTPADGYAMLRSLPKLPQDERGQFHSSMSLAFANEAFDASNTAGGAGCALEQSWRNIQRICDTLQRAFDSTLEKPPTSTEKDL